MTSVGISAGTGVTKISAENWVLYTIGAATTMGIDGTSTINELYAENAYL